MYLSVCCLVM